MQTLLRRSVLTVVLVVQLLVLASVAAMAAALITGISGLILSVGIFDTLRPFLFGVLWVGCFLLTLKGIDLKSVVLERFRQK
jgi:hypothetical protein